MNRKAFLLGFFSIGGQVLLLRELVSSLNGDELFIGVALFSWLASVAIGSIIGGRDSFQMKSFPLFFAAVIFLPASIMGVRLSSVIIGLNAGEIIPFASAALISISMMLPVGLIFGALFSVITREGYRPAESIARVYLFEGLGAFVGGIANTALVGRTFSTLSMAVALGLTTITLYLLPIWKKKILFIGGLLFVLLLLIKSFVPFVDTQLDSLKYKSYRIEASFDTHYGHQAILSRDSAVSLLTDNTVEGSYPDLMAAENILIPPLLYNPQAQNILFIGRTELGIRQLAYNLPNLKITALDPREPLSSALDRIIPPGRLVQRLADDPVAFLARRNILTKYDIIIINCGEPDNYKNSRFLNDNFLMTASTLLKEGGVLFYPSKYDSDRHISPDKAEILSIISGSLKKAFAHISVWSGEMTLFFASDKPLFDLPVDSIIARADSLGYRPQYISADYLIDRFQRIKTDRLNDALKSSTEINTLGKPNLIYKQAIFRSKIDTIDRAIIPLVFKENIWIVILPAVILAILVLTIMKRQRRRLYGLFLFFAAGLVSLSLELISFYVYQTSAGSIYSEMGALIGIFMLGLSLGTFISLRMDNDHLEFPALILLLAGALVFMATYSNVNPKAVLYYYLFFMFTIAIGSGSLFVAAANRYYFGRPESNRGLGYAFELAGSSIGALVPTMILLPLIGLQWLIISIIIFLLVALLAAILTG